MKRRDFIKGTILAATSSGLASCQSDSKPVAKPILATDAQRALRRTGRSTVGIIPCASYEENIFELLKSFETKLKMPDVKGKSVVLKPNMIEVRGPGSPITTNPAILKAAIQFFDHLGAREVIVAEGPGHMRDTEYLLHQSGLGKVIEEMKVRFVDLNLDDIVAVKNLTGFNKLNEFYLPKTIVEADCIISLPKMKTHHWVGVTCSMKNFFGVVPGRKYGWPKNILHKNGIERSIIDLQHMVKPAFAIVDAVVAMEGDGPINGTPIETKYIIVGDDLAAIDATAARLMSIDPKELPYLVLAGQVVGNIEIDQIDIIGPSIDQLKKPFEQPITLSNKALLTQAADSGS
ncbi:MAG: DUF362 domain-containing protein [Candidatus Melainabacteria bacterium]|nr:DUF362 domain-containing protein [Candidatus Melainabacteria bacterium]